MPRALPAGWNSALLWPSWYEPPNDTTVTCWAGTDAAPPAIRATAKAEPNRVFACIICLLVGCCLFIVWVAPLASFSARMWSADKGHFDSGAIPLQWARLAWWVDFSSHF